MGARMGSGSPTWIKVLLGLMTLVLAGVAALSMLGRQATARWETYAASLRAKGQPLTFDEIESQRKAVPDDRNSALVFANLAEQYKAFSDSGVDPDVFVIGGRNDRGDFFGGVSPRRIEASRKYIAKLGDLLAGLEALRDKPTGRFKIDYDRNNPIGTLLPHLARLRSTSKLIRTDAMVRLVDSDKNAAVRDFELQCRIAGSLFDEPTLISRLVQIAIDAQACHSVEEILRVVELDDEALRGIARELGDRRAGGTMRWGLLGERAFFIETCDAMVAGRVPLSEIELQGYAGNDVDPVRMLRRIPTFLARSNQLHGAEMYTWLVDAVDDHDKMRAAAARMEAEMPKLSRTQVLVKILMPSLSRAMLLNTKIAAEFECTLAGVAAERFRLAAGRMPKSLEELVPQYLDGLPIDPFDGKPLRFTSNDDGIVIYSIDENQTDDGGDVGYKPPTKERKRAPDVGFRLFRPDRRGVLMVDDPPPDGE